MPVELSTLHARPALLERPLVACLALLVLLGLAGCGRRVPAVVAEQGDPAAIPGLIDVGLEGFTPEHHALGARLGEVLEDERLVDDPFDGVDEPEELLVLRVDPAREAAILDELRRRPDVHFAEPVVRVQALWVPDDPQFAQQWHLRAAGATSAWDSARGAGVTVAVIDTGVAPVDDLDPARLLRGHNFLNDGDDARDDHGHGTHVAGTVAQTTDNGIGVAGMAPLARLLPLKVLGADGSGTSVAIADAIRWAADHGARVLNLSLGGGARSAAMADAVAYARSRGQLRRPAGTACPVLVLRARGAHRGAGRRQVAGRAGRRAAGDGRPLLGGGRLPLVPGHQHGRASRGRGRGVAPVRGRDQSRGGGKAAGRERALSRRVRRSRDRRRRGAIWRRAAGRIRSAADGHHLVGVVARGVGRRRRVARCRACAPAGAGARNARRAVARPAARRGRVHAAGAARRGPAPGTRAARAAPARARAAFLRTGGHGVHRLGGGVRRLE